MSAAGGSPGARPKHLVVDANVVIKWHVAEVHTDAALRLLRDDEIELHVPDLVFPEVGNILWKKVRRGELTEEEARRIARLVAAAPLTVHPSAPLLEAATEIALRTGRTVYDSQYVALALKLDSGLVTADERLYNALKGGPLGANILWVEDDPGISAIGAAEDLVIDVGALPAISADEIELEYSHYTGDRLKDENLAHLAGLPQLRGLYLSSPAITDAGLVHLRNLVELRTLYLDGTSVTDAGLIHINQLHRLETLNLKGTAITDAGLVQLSALAELRWLSLRETTVTDAGLINLRDLVGLEWLDLSSTSITDGGLVHLHGLSGLRTLDLAGTSITNAGLVHLRSLTGLLHLHLSGTRVTDAGLRHLHALTSLLELDVEQTRVSTVGVDHLRRALPELEIKARTLHGLG